MDPRLITPLLVAALVVWSVYRRTRRSFGRQAVQPGRLWFRIGLFAFLGGLILLTSPRDPRLLAGLAGGVICGAALGLVGLRYTKFEVSPEGRFYTPHMYIGVLVTALFIGRILYRFVSIYAGAHGLALAGPGLGDPNAYQNPYAYQRSPATLALFGAFVGYYLVYYIGVMTKTRLPALSGEQSGAP